MVEDISANVEWRRHNVGSGSGPMVSHINLRRLRVMGLWRIHIIRSVVPACVAGSLGGPHITIKELLPIVLGVALWGKQWVGKTVRCRCDNAAAVAAVNSGSSKNERMMQLLWSVFFFYSGLWYHTSSGTHTGGGEQGGRCAVP